jgi:glycosyltransferase involved in cell wall biosynthesis
MNTPIKLLFVLTRLGTGGAPIQVVSLMRGMQRFGYSPLLATGNYDPRYDGDMSYLLRAGDPVRWIPEMSRAVSIRGDLVSVWHLYRLIREIRPAIVHTHTAKAGLLGRIAAYLAGVPVIVHTFHGNLFRGYFSRPVSWLLKQMERRLAGLTDCVCVLSNQQATELAETLGRPVASKLRVLSLGLDLEPFADLNPPPNGDSPFTVGWLGRLVPIKNIELLISVMEETRRRNPRIHFLVAGDGPEREAVERAAARFGKHTVTWVGWQQDISSVVSQCHLLMQTSRNEGTPIALIQGMAAGRPFVSTAVGGLIDMVEGPLVRRSPGCRWFSNGVLAEPKAFAFASAICELAGAPNQLRAMGQAAAGFAAMHYSLPTLLESTSHLYGELIEKKSASPAVLSAPSTVRETEAVSRAS